MGIDITLPNATTVRTKFAPGSIVHYLRPDGRRMRVRAVVACVQGRDSDPEGFQVFYICEWVATLSDELHRMHIPETSLAAIPEGEED